MTAACPQPGRTGAGGGAGGWPLMGVQYARARLGLNEAGLYDLADSGELLWVWNIAVRPGRRREPRFLVPEIEARRAGAKYEAGWSDVLAVIRPHRRQAWRCFELARARNCNHGHVRNLLASRQLQARRRWHRGRESGLYIYLASIQDFLRQRLWVP